MLRSKIIEKINAAFHWFCFFCMLITCGFSMERLRDQYTRFALINDMESKNPFLKTGRYKER